MGDDDYVNKNARNTDPSTSKDAGENIRQQKLIDRATVYAVYKKHHPRPLADYELEAILGGPANGKWRKRRADLKDDGILIFIKTAINPDSRKEVIQWGLKTDPTQVKPPRQPSLLTLMGVSESEWAAALKEARSR